MSAKTETPVGSRRKKQKQETNALILEKARALFDDRGFEKTTIRAIAAEAGLGLGTIFSHFPDKKSLLVALLLKDLKETEEKAMDSMPAEGSISNKFLHLAQHFFSYYSKRPSLSRTILKEMWFLQGPWGDELKTQAWLFVAKVENMFEQAKLTGEIKPDADSALAAMSFFSHYLNVLFMGLSGDDFNEKEMPAVLEKMLAQIIDGIGAV